VRLYRQIVARVRRFVPAVLEEADEEAPYLREERSALVRARGDGVLHLNEAHPVFRGRAEPPVFRYGGLYLLRAEKVFGGDDVRARRAYRLRVGAYAARQIRRGAKALHRVVDREVLARADDVQYAAPAFAAGAVGAVGGRHGRLRRFAYGRAYSRRQRLCLAGRFTGDRRRYS